MELAMRRESGMRSSRVLVQPCLLGVIGPIQSSLSTSYAWCYGDRMPTLSTNHHQSIGPGRVLQQVLHVTLTLVPSRTDFFRPRSSLRPRRQARLRLS